MKTRTSSLLLLAAALAAFASISASAAVPETAARGYRVSNIERHNQPIVEHGTAEMTVRRLLGEPYRKLSPEVWAYGRFAASDWKIETGDCTTLLVIFTNGKVTELKLVNDGAEKIYAAQLRAKPSNKSQVAGK